MLGDVGCLPHCLSNYGFPSGFSLNCTGGGGTCVQKGKLSGSLEKTAHGNGSGVFPPGVSE